MKTLRLIAFVLATTAALRASGAVQTLSLEEAKEEALRNHPAYAAAQLRALLAKESLRETRAAYFPNANGYVTAVDTAWDNTRILAGGINNPSVYDRVGEGIAVTQLITDFGHTSNLSSGARALLKAANAGAEDSRNQILLNVQANYFATLQAQAVLRASQENLEAQELLLKQVTALEKNQLRSDLDVSFALVAKEQAELVVQNSEGDVEGAMASLGAALGTNETTTFVLTDRPGEAPAPGALDELVATALSQRPDLLNLRYQADSAHSFAAAQRDANYPTVAAVGVVGNAISHAENLPDRYAAAGLQMSIPLFEGGAYVARQHEAELRARVAQEALREAEDNVVRDVRLALVAARTSFKRLATTRLLVDHANQAFRLAQARYKAGSSSIVELSEAQLNQTSAAIALANASFDTNLRAAALAYQTGTLR
jgi:outer membrane protein